MMMIETNNLTKRFRNHTAVRDLSLAVRGGAALALVGANGAGKTTLIKVLLGIVRKSSGQARMLGANAGNRSARRQVGYLPENHRIPRHLTANTALEYYGGLSGMSLGEIRKKRRQLLETVGLGDWGKTSVKKYSKGMLQRLGLAQAMLPLLDPDDFGRVSDKPVGQLADMDQTVLMNADIDKCPECSHIGDYSRQVHARFQIGYFLKILGKSKMFKVLAGISAGSC